MTYSIAIFIALAIITIGAAIAVVTLRNVFHAALMLVVAFFGVAGFYVLLEAGFFAAAQVLVYIGAISVLLIFSVMLTRGVFMAQARNQQSGYAAVAAGVMFILIAALVGPIALNWPGLKLGNFVLPPRVLGNPIEFAVPSPKAVQPDYLTRFGSNLIETYGVGFLLAGVLLLLAMVGAIWVARERKLMEIVLERREMAAEAKVESDADTAAGAEAPAIPAAATPPEPAAGAAH
ncbi:MAG: NADH-quinone oxidoreductase subunit J [Thermoflexales bacterium]|nr:NADH-quinone oxidoreductase subunit J [Thermoflexales bacterium]